MSELDRICLHCPLLSGCRPTSPYCPRERARKQLRRNRNAGLRTSRKKAAEAMIAILSLDDERTYEGVRV